MLDSFGVQAVLHCGDIGSADVVQQFGKWPTHFVFGNVDDPRSIREAIAAAGQTCHERFGTLEILGRKIAFLHGDDLQGLRDAIVSGRYDLVCHGHTHQALTRRQGATLILNPGALYRADPHSIAIVDLPGMAVETIRV